MNYHIVCPYCEYKLMKAKDGTDIEMLCPQCKEKLSIEVKNQKIIINKIEKAKSAEK